ncbi:glutathione S-transferase [Ceraceosorus guamensis]|uniref:Glutathione S-transferase n=1 Tax=Ceraceosorus guamensis TaxID=1522189 RepID=A0A316W177_9BASI|nr:glutathione S-transferase [Ceraceosorus guamensis]PWN42878.1 glutathione S-transferase [Ceraceosorus guamensis]
MSTLPSSQPRHANGYHLQCTGQALETARRHEKDVAPSTEDEITLYGSCFCPFVHRAWITLEVLGLPYKYVEGEQVGGVSSRFDPASIRLLNILLPLPRSTVDPYAKPASLLALNPKGLVPAVQVGPDPRNGLGESTVIMEYLAERSDSRGGALFPSIDRPFQRAQARLAADKINRTLLPAFYRYLQAQEVERQVEAGREFLNGMTAFVESMQQGSGPFWDGTDKIGWADVMIAPWAIRAGIVLKHYRGFDMRADPNGRYEKWQSALLAHPAVKATTSTDELYLDSYARYAENRPNTSQVAEAINSGRECVTC